MARAGKSSRQSATRRTKRKSRDMRIADLLRRHLGRMKPERLTICERQFPFRVRADLQRAVELVLERGSTVRQFCGIRKEYDFHGLDLAGLFVEERHYPAVAVPPMYEEVDIGED